MGFRILCLITIGCLVTLANSAAIDNSVYTDEGRINSSEELLSTIVEHCFHGNAMHCLKEKVLSYLDNIAGLDESSQGRSFREENIDKVIVDRVGRILSTNEFRVQLPETLFQNAIISYRPDTGMDFSLPTKGEGRGLLLKKKLFLPILLLLKLKMKALMPLIVTIVGLKAMKALILSKIAIKLVLGFLIYNFVKKMGGMKMGMMPMMMPPPEPPMTAYGAPISTTPSSYDPSSWEPSNGGPYSRVWDSANSGSAHNMAYSSYYPSSSSSYSSISSGGSGSPGSGSYSTSSPSSSSYSS